MGIAFNVTDTASAANDMSNRAREVSAEAEQTEQHALSVRENAAALELAVAELRHAVIRVVRTSTTEVDRRRAARYPVDLTCRVTAGSGTQDARLTDLSETGAQWTGGPVLQPGAAGTVSIEGVTIPFVVCSADHRGGLHVQFEENAARRQAVSRLLDRLQCHRVA